jgi:Flp pilus assembly CpaE family ATPase
MTKQAAAVREMGLKLAATGVGHRKAFVTSVNNGKGVTEMFPKDKAAEELRKLWNELSPPEKPAKIKGGRITKEKTQ